MQTQERVKNGEITVGGATVFTPEMPNAQRDPQYVGYRYYTYNGTNMKDEEIFYWNRWTGWKDISRGYNAANDAAGAWSIVFDGIAYLPYIGTALSLFNSGQNAAQAYRSAMGTYPISGGSSDFIQCSITYDTYKKWSYRQSMMPGGWYGYSLGLMSEKATIIKIETEQYYAGNTSRRYTSTNTLNQVIQTPNFAYPDATAWTYAPYAPKTEQIYYLIPGTNHRLMFQ